MTTKEPQRNVAEVPCTAVHTATRSVAGRTIDTREKTVHKHCPEQTVRKARISIISKQTARTIRKNQERSGSKTSCQGVNIQDTPLSTLVTAGTRSTMADCVGPWRIWVCPDRSILKQEMREMQEKLEKMVFLKSHLWHHTKCVTRCVVRLGVTVAVTVQEPGKTLQ